MASSGRVAAFTGARGGLIEYEEIWRPPQRPGERPALAFTFEIGARYRVEAVRLALDGPLRSGDRQRRGDVGGLLRQEQADANCLERDSQRGIAGERAQIHQKAAIQKNEPWLSSNLPVIIQLMSLRLPSRARQRQERHQFLIA
jgi:hypothetical protein